MADEAHIRHLAHLARLDLTEDEVAAFAAEATSILASFEELPSGGSLDEAVPPEDAGRDDDPVRAPPEQVEAILAAVPHKRDRHVLAPRGGT